MNLELQFQSLETCPSCRSTDRFKVFEIQQSAVYECQACSLRYLNPCVRQDAMMRMYGSESSLELMHDFHTGYQHYGSLESRSQTLREYERAMRLVSPYASRGNLLDLGCGNGFFLAYARTLGWKVEGIESSADNVRIAKEKFGLEIRKGNILGCLKDHAYDLVSILDVLEHFSNPHELLDKVISALKPKGCVLIAVPNDVSFLRLAASALFRITGGQLKGPLSKVYLFEHVAYYNIRSLDHLMRSRGFSLKGSFQSSTDLNKYRLNPIDKKLASLILFIGKLTKTQNRLVALYQKE